MCVVRFLCFLYFKNNYETINSHHFKRNFLIILLMVLSLLVTHKFTPLSQVKMFSNIIDFRGLHSYIVLY